MPSAYITNIQRYSIHDGPGIRTTVFFKGCNLHCPWCHNPETVKSRQELYYYEEKCIQCRACVNACPSGLHHFSGDIHSFDRDKCTVCGACAALCYAGALVPAARLMSVDEVMDAILRDRDFYEASGDGNEKGGVTFSGGEPLLQKDFLPALLAACKAAGISTAIETALNVPAETLLKIIPYTGLFLADLKHPQESELKAVTGADLGLVVGNLALLVQSKAAVIVRIPIIPGYNDTLAIMEETALLLDVLGLHQVELLPFHNFGEAKCWSLGISYAYTDVQPPSPNLMNILRQPFETGSFSSVMPHNKI